MDSLKRLRPVVRSVYFVPAAGSGRFPKPLFDHFVARLESFLFIFARHRPRIWRRSFSQWADRLPRDCRGVIE